MKMNIALIITGAVLVIIGTVRMVIESQSSVNVASDNNIHKETARSRRSATDDNSHNIYDMQDIIKDSNANALINNHKVFQEDISKNTNGKSNDPKKKGNDFEGYIADILKNNQIRLRQWNQGATSPGGAYAENELNPDFFVSQKCKQSELEYWIECKYRSSLPEKGFMLEDYQLERYASIQKESRRKILIALGTEGAPTSPSNIYVIPLDTLRRFKRIGHKYLPHYILTQPETSFRNHIEAWFLNEVFKK